MHSMPVAQVGRELLDEAEVAVRLSCSAATVSRLIRSGELPSVKLGRRRRVRARDLERYLEGLK